MRDDRILEPAVDKIRVALQDAVREALKTRPDGAHLTYVGGVFGRQVGAPFEQYVNFLVLQEKANIPSSMRKMLPFIREYCSDLFELIEQAGGTYLIRERGKEPLDVSQLSIDESLRVTFKKSIWLAFVRPLPEGQRRYLNLGDHPGFTDLTPEAVASPEWKEIDRKFIVGVPLGSRIDAHLVREAITRWARESDIEISQLTLSELDATLSRPRLSDLARIVAALPPELASRWMIPAEILRYLKN